MKEAYIEKIYAGWLAKIIGIRLGAPVENWTYEKIKNVVGPIDGYPVAYKNFAADDDSNGPLFFLRGLEDSGHTADGGRDFTAQDVADALLNYAPYEHGFFWWGGYGNSTEHTAYLNLRNGIPAPRSGSIEQNGSTVAEQIGGQIFIDTWGLVAPGNPDLAARLAKEAASVTHDGNGVYGGIFVASCISHAFEENSIRAIIEKGLSYIPADCEYTRAVRAVMAYYDSHENSTWEDAFRYVKENFGYDKYPGHCHIIPNTCVMILALLYGEGDFAGTLNIGCMCGWDTDCNVGNIATIMGVRGGLKAIDYRTFRKPVNDLLICSGVVGSLNIMDIPYGALYIAGLAYALAGEELPGKWKEIRENRIDSCHFEFPGSTHAFRVRTDGPEAKEIGNRCWRIENSAETAASGSRSLKFTVAPSEAGEHICVYKKTYYYPEDFNDSRYDPSFCPTVYPGQTVHASAFVPEYSRDTRVSLYVHDGFSGKTFESERTEAVKGKWMTLSYEIPHMKDALIDEVGVIFLTLGDRMPFPDYSGFIDDLYIDGKPSYAYSMRAVRNEAWNNAHGEISQFTRLKGLMYPADGELQLSCADFAECYTGRHDWTDYTASFTIVPRTGDWHAVNFRVQGAIRSYAAALLPDGKAGILKNENGYRLLTEADYAWKQGEPVKITVTVRGNMITADVAGVRLQYTDKERPYLNGSIGLSVRNGSHVSLREIEITPDM